MGALMHLLVVNSHFIQMRVNRTPPIILTHRGSDKRRDTSHSQYGKRTWVSIDLSWTAVQPVSGERLEWHSNYAIHSRWRVIEQPSRHFPKPLYRCLSFALGRREANKASLRSVNVGSVCLDLAVGIVGKTCIKTLKAIEDSTMVATLGDRFKGKDQLWHLPRSSENTVRAWISLIHAP